MPWRTIADPHNPENRNAGNLGDLVKHTVYLTALRVLLRHDPWRDGLQLHECHAGRGMYRHEAGDERQALVARLLQVAPGTLPLADLQRQLLEHFDALPREGAARDGVASGYAGSALQLTALLAAHRRAHQSATAQAAHRYEGYEWAPDTRQLLRQVLTQADQGDLPVQVLEPDEGDRAALRFDGESHVIEAMPHWSRADVLCLDPFGLWAAERLAYRRARYRRLLHAWLERGQQAPTVLWFWVWAAADGDEAVIRDGPPVGDGYRELGSLLELHGRPPVVVRWRDELCFGMWVLAPPELVEVMAVELDDACGALASHLGVAAPAVTRGC
jgi:23S rRNA A2030 N6-methylase RlmJ